MRIKVSPVFTKIRSSNKKIIVNEGSSRSTKTISTLQACITDCLENKGWVHRIFRKHLPWTKSTVMEDFLTLVEETYGLPPRTSNHFNKTNNTYHFPNGSKVIFGATKDAQRLHGAKQNSFYINEAIESEESSFKQLLLRTTDKVYLDYNPSTDQHWIYDTVLTRDDVFHIHSTYKDNPFLSKEIIDEIERLEPTDENIRRGTANEGLWKIYGLGQRHSIDSYFNKLNTISQMPSGNSYMWIDPSFEGGDYTSPTVFKPYLHGIAVEGRCFKKAWYDCIDEIREMVKKHNVTKIGFETNSLGDLPLRELKKELGITVIGMKTTLNKHRKITTASGYSSSIFMSDYSDREYKSQVKNYSYKAKNDDGPDSLASGLLWMGLIR